jgi:hypothetical protein
LAEVINWLAIKKATLEKNAIPWIVLRAWFVLAADLNIFIALAIPINWNDSYCASWARDPTVANSVKRDSIREKDTPSAVPEYEPVHGSSIPQQHQNG